MISVGKHLVQYNAMRNAIATCDRLDECKDIVDKSVALSAYFAQVKDFKTELAFNRVRVRAWRRIAEIISAVDLKGCDTQLSKVKRVRAAYGDDPTVESLSDSRIYELLRLAQLTEAEFEHATNQTISGSLADLFRRTPAAEREYAENVRRREEEHQESEEERKKNRAQAERQRAKQEEINRHWNELNDAANDAMNEVGITLERKDRAKMRQVVFLIKEEVHAVMRQAAFDKKITMQDVLRRGLKLWLEANGYDFPDDHAPGGARQKQEEMRP